MTTTEPTRTRDTTTGYLTPIHVEPPDDDVREALAHLTANRSQR